MSWDEYFGGMALLAAAPLALRAPARSRPCVERAATGGSACFAYGFFQGAPHQSIMAHGHEQATVHAEQNAIAHAARVEHLRAEAAPRHRRPADATWRCRIVAAGIRRVHTPTTARHDPAIVDTLRRRGTFCARRARYGGGDRACPRFVFFLFK